MKAFLAAAAVMSAEPSVAVVAGTGVSLVFLILLLLTFVITVQGKIFGAIEQRKKAKAAPAAPAVPAPAAPVKCPPFVEEGIPEEVVAVIAAAVAASSGGKYTLRSLTRVSSGRGSWGAAGVVSGTEPF